MKSLEIIKDMICNELDEIADKGNLDLNNLDVIDKLTHSLKSIYSVMAMETGNEKNPQAEKLRAMLKTATTEKEKAALEECIEKLES